MDENHKCPYAELIKKATEMAIEEDDVGHLLTHMANSVGILLDVTSNNMDEMLDGLKEFGEQVIGIAMIISRMKKRAPKQDTVPSDDQITDEIRNEVQAFLKTIGGSLEDPPKPH